MIRRLILLLLGTVWLTTPALAVTQSGTFVTSSPTVSNWSSGWPTGGTTGWNYVGQIGGASGVYLGNGWVLTARHVGSGAFTLGGTTYQPVAGSDQYFSNSDGTADLTLFRIATAPTLRPLTLSTAPPVPFSSANHGDVAVMIGYGGGHGETWGANTIGYVDELVQIDGLAWNTNDFLTLIGTFTAGSLSYTNVANFVGGDSGGGDFIYNSQTSSWNLAGINEVVGTATINSQTVDFCGMVQLSTYAAQINAIVTATDTPAMPSPALWLMACLLLVVASGFLKSKRRPA